MSDCLKHVTAAILAGGQGTRLRAVVADRQKVVAPVAGRPFLYRLLDQLADAGVRRIIICTGYQSGQVSDAFGETYRDIELRYSAEAEPLGTAGALRQALPLLDSDPILALNGDSFCETELPSLLAAHQSQATIVVREVPDTTQSGRVEFDTTGAVTSFIEKGQTTGSGWISAGVYLLNLEVLASVPVGRAVSIEREVFPVLVGRGLRVFRTDGRFLDIGTPESYANAQRYFK